VHNDLISAVDQGNVGALALLDLSSAFDTGIFGTNFMAFSFGIVVASPGFGLESKP